MRIQAKAMRYTSMLVAATISVTGCKSPNLYTGNERPTYYRRISSIEQDHSVDRLRELISVSPDQIKRKCGNPDRIWVSRSSKENSEYAVIQTHMLYSKKRSEVVVSSYPNARNSKRRGWFYSGTYQPNQDASYHLEEATKRMPCLSTEIKAWQMLPPAIIK